MPELQQTGGMSAVLGAGYASWMIMKFILWLDGADQLDEEDDIIAVEPAPSPRSDVV